MTLLSSNDLEKAKIDVDHIAAISTSTAPTATDRLGHVKPTLTGALSNIAAEINLMHDAVLTAIATDLPASIASVAAMNPRGAWVAATAYTYRDIVSSGGAWYVCVVPHTSSAAFVTDAASKWRIYQGVTTGDLSASSGSALVGHLPTSGAPTTVQDKLRQFGSDAYLPSTRTPYAAISVNPTRTTIDRHAFEDWTVIATTAETGMGYSSFDAKASMTNASPQSHMVGYQSRNIYAGSGGLVDYFHGYDVHMTHSGTGVVSTAKGIDIGELQGSGPVTNNYGIFMSGNLRGANAWSIYVASGKCYFPEVHAGIVLSNTQHGGIAYNVDVAGKDLSYGYGTAGFLNYGTHNFYDGKGGLVLTITYQGLVLSKDLTVVGGARFHAPLELVAGANHAISMGTGWVWTADGLKTSAIKGAIYANADGTLALSAGPTLSAGLIVSPNSVKVVGAFGANGVIPQPKYGVNTNCTDLPTAVALINQLRAALINNGICV